MPQCRAVNGTLYIVATPIGNLEDISERALRILREVDVIACEDTRRTRVLLNAFGIKTKAISYHEHNERARAVALCEQIESGKSVALVSDAGTPLISDPGFRIVQAAIEREISVVSIPGATAFVAALAASGLPSDPNIDVAAPVPSPDGHQIAFVSGNQVWLMNADGTRPTALTRSDPASFPYSCRAPAWTKA